MSFNSLISDIVGTPIDRAQISMPVKVFFKSAGEVIFLPKVGSAEKT